VSGAQVDDLFGDLCLASPGGGGGGGDWLDDDDEEDPFWSSGPSGGSSSAASAAASAGEGFGGPAAVAQTWRDASLGVLGEEVARVEAGRKSAGEMERLTEAAHERKAAAKSRAAEAAAKKAEAEAKAAEAVEAKRRELHGQREQAAEAAASGARAAQARLDADRAAGLAGAALEENEAAQEEELMVLEAVLGEEGFEREEEAAPPAFRLTVAGERARGEPTAVQLRVTFVVEYPSHLPPRLEIVDGVAAEDAPLVRDSLLALFYAQREESAAAGEPAEGVVHRWTEWVKEEWMPSS